MPKRHTTTLTILAALLPLVLVAQLTQDWAHEYDTKTLFPTPGRGRAIAVDGSGNVYVAGTGDNGPTGFDYLVMKYSPAGETL